MPAQLADAPELPMHCAHIWDAFLTMHRSRGNNGYGPVRLSLHDFDGFNRVTGGRLSAWEIGAIQGVDSAYMASLPKAKT